MLTRRANFREEQLFLSCIPICENNIDIKNSAKRNVLTSSLISTYPFISSSIFDEKGLFIGKNIYNNSLIFVDFSTNKNTVTLLRNAGKLSSLTNQQKFEVLQ